MATHWQALSKCIVQSFLQVKGCPLCLTPVADLYQTATNDYDYEMSEWKYNECLW